MFEDLYRRYYQSAVAFFVRLGFSRDEARELAQETFYRVYIGMKSYRGDAEWGYIETAARHVAINEIRRRRTGKRAAREVSIQDLPLLASSFSKDPWTGQQPLSQEEELVEGQETTQRRKRLYAAIAELPDNIRICLLLRLGGLSYLEIEKKLQVSMDTVKARLHQARKLLKAMLGEESEGLAALAELPEDDRDQEG